MWGNVPGYLIHYAEQNCAKWGVLAPNKENYWLWYGRLLPCIAHNITDKRKLIHAARCYNMHTRLSVFVGRVVLVVIALFNAGHP